MQALNRQETEDYVIDLYYNQKKTFREIQKYYEKALAIKKILDKNFQNELHFLSLQEHIGCLRKEEVTQ